MEGDMVGANVAKRRPHAGVPSTWSLGMLVLACAMGSSASAVPYIGESFLQIPGVAGDWKGQEHRNWVKTEAHYWKKDESLGIFGAARGRRGANGLRGRGWFSAPTAPRQGPDKLVISVDKHNPVLPQLMKRCASKVTMPDLTFAESSVRSRPLTELGDRPDTAPAWFEYKLTGVQFIDCPVVPAAPEQAIVVSFNNIEWLNYKGDGEGVDNHMPPAVLAPISSSGTTKSFVISWFAQAHDVSDNQCAKLNERPSEDEYYALMTPQEAAAERERLKSQGGVGYENGVMDLRGPHKLSATLLPGIVPDPGLVVPQTNIARGLDLDGDDGTGKPPPGIRKHKNYVSEDGRKGIDNQLFTVQGCIKGYMGHKGFLMQYSNEQRRNGLVSMIVQISGIDNDRDDDSVDVTMLYSRDPMAKNADGSRILPDYTFRLTDDVAFTHYFARLHGRIVNGVIITDPVEKLQFQPGIDAEITFYHAAMRLQIQPDGTLKGVVGGYQDWRRLTMINAGSTQELNFGLNVPALYDAFKRYADGMKDPVTGQYLGISSAYDIEAVPAFIPPRQLRALAAQGSATARN
jgi:hypothetical protein